jgi:hypothetical protein
VQLTTARLSQLKLQVMGRLFKQYNAWRSRRQQLSLARWAQERAKGRARYVLRQAFTFAVLMTACRDVINHFYNDGGHVFGDWFYIAQHAVTGLFIGYVTWSDQEGKYKDAQITARLQTPFDNRIKPR